jgi:hypothetical protein
MQVLDQKFSVLLSKPVVIGTDYILQSDDGTTIRLITLPDHLEPLSTEVVTQAVAGVSTTPIPNLTVRQFLCALTLEGLITESEAMNRSSIPVAIDAYLATLPAESATVARITWATMVTIPRNDPLVDLLGAVLNKTPEQIDQFFIQAATI